MNFAVFYILGGLLILAVFFGGIGFIIGNNDSVRMSYFVGLVLAGVIAMPATMFMVDLIQSDINSDGAPFGYAIGAFIILIAGFGILGGRLGARAAGRRNQNRKDPLVETST